MLVTRVVFGGHLTISTFSTVFTILCNIKDLAEVLSVSLILPNESLQLVVNIWNKLKVKS